MPTGTCALCQNVAELQLSHILPAFGVKWLKENSATGRLRGWDNPNLPIQDGDKLHLLCKDCEDRFNKGGESQFAERIFAPFQASNQYFEQFDYEEWLRYFAVSLAWRVVVTKVDAFRSVHPDLAAHADMALERWRRFLLGLDPDPGPYEHHIFFFGFASSKNDTVPDGLHGFTLGAMAHGIGNSSTAVLSFSQLPGIMFWTTIHPVEAEGGVNTLIAARGKLVAPQSPPDHYGQFLLEQLEAHLSALGNISESQREKTRQAILRNPTRWYNSAAKRVVDADRFWNASDSPVDSGEASR